MIATALGYLEAIFSWLLAASWQASVLALLVLLAQTLLRGRLNPRWRYALWLLVLARLFLPALPESALSLFQFAPPPPPALVAPVTTSLFVEAPAPLPALPLSASAPLPEPAHPFSLYSLLALIWLTGAVLLFLLTWQVNRRFARQVAASPEITDPDLRALFAQTQMELNLRRTIRLIESPHVQSPAIMGLFSPTLLLPANVRSDFDRTELRLIFLHELAHLKRGDVIAQGLIAFLQILHWFNPVLWFAFRRMRADREPATDALVLSRAGESEKERYGLMLIKLLENFNQRHSLPTLVGILEDKDQFKRRFSLIARFTRSAYGWSLLGVLLIGILSITCLTRSKAAVASVDSPLSVAPQTQPPPPATEIGPPAMVRVALRVMQMDETDYQAHRADVDAAVQKGDYQPLSQLRSCRLISEPAVLTRSGEQGVLEAVRVMSVPIKFEKDANGKMTATDFKKQNLGVRFVLLPKFADGKIELTGNLTVSSFEGWIQAEDHTQRPTFHIRTAPVLESFAFDQSKGFEMPDGAQMERDDPTAVSSPDHSLDESKNSRALRRIFFFVTSAAYDQVGHHLSAPSDANALPPPIVESNSQPIGFENNLLHARIENLDVKDMPLPDFINKISEEIRQNDPEKKGVPLELELPPGEAPVAISMASDGSSLDLIYLLEKLKDIYPIRYEITENSVKIRQLSKTEAALSQKAEDTRVDLDLSATEAVSALQTLQREARAKGFDFNLDCATVPPQPSRPVTLHVKGCRVKQALLSICYQGDLIGKPLPDFTGYRITLGSSDELHDRVSLIIGTYATVLPSDNPTKIAATEALGSMEGPNLITPAYPRSHHGEKTELGGEIAFEISEAPEALHVSFKYNYAVLDKSHIRMAGTAEIKDKQGEILGKISGQWTAASGTNAVLHASDDKPLMVKLRDGKEWAVLLEIRTAFADPEGKSTELLLESYDSMQYHLIQVIPDQSAKPAPAKTTDAATPATPATTSEPVPGHLISPEGTFELSPDISKTLSVGNPKEPVTFQIENGQLVLTRKSPQGSLSLSIIHDGWIIYADATSTLWLYDGWGQIQSIRLQPDGIHPASLSNQQPDIWPLAPPLFLATIEKARQDKAKTQTNNAGAAEPSIPWNSLTSVQKAETQAQLDTLGVVYDMDMTDALIGERNDIVKRQYERGNSHCSALTYAISQGASVAEVGTMLKNGTSVQAEKDEVVSPLCMAVDKGDLPLVTFLIEHGADPNWHGKGNYMALSAMSLALFRPDIVAYLLDHGVRAEFEDLHSAIAMMDPDRPDPLRAKRKETIHLLLDHGALDRQPPLSMVTKADLLRIACLNARDIDVVKWLLDHGCTPDQRDYLKKKTVLEWVRDASEGKNNWPIYPEFKPILALLEAADKTTDVSPAPTPFKTVAIQGKVRVTAPETIDFVQSTVLLDSVDNDHYQTPLQPDGSFLLPGVKPGVYNPRIHLVGKTKQTTPLMAEMDDTPMAVLTIPDTAPKMTLNWSVESPFKNDYPANSIRLGLRVVEISDDDYQTNRIVIDAAITRGDTSFFEQMKGVSILSPSTVTTQSGKQASVDVVREFPYPTAFDEQGKTVSPSATSSSIKVPPTPREFVTRNLGVMAEMTPSLDHGKIMLNGKLSIVEFTGFTPSNLGVQMPCFNTRDSHFLEELDDNRQMGLLIPGVYLADRTASTGPPGTPPAPPTARDTSKRIILFLAAQRVN